MNFFKETPFRSFTEKQFESIKVNFIDYVTYKISVEKEEMSLRLKNEASDFVSLKAETYKVDLNPYNFMNYKEKLVDFAQTCLPKHI